MTADLPRRAAAEFLGSAFLLAAVVGSGIMAAKLAGGNGALALLCNTLPTGAILVVLILIFGPVSGAHFNPAVTLAFAFRREMPSTAVAVYLVAQVAGAIIGAWLAHLMFELPVIQISATARVGPWPMDCRSCRDVRAVADDLRMPRGRARCDSLCGRPLHHRRLLVHRVNVLRKSGGDDRAIFIRYVRRHLTGRRPGLHRGAICRCVRRNSARAVALAHQQATA